MKNLISKAILAVMLAVVSTLSAAQGIVGLQFLGANGRSYASADEAWAVDRARAQVYGQIRTGAASGTWVQAAPMFWQFTPVQSAPGHFVAQGKTYHCPSLIGWAGGLFGAFVGHNVGKEIKISTGNLGGLGAVVGAVAGNQIACELIEDKEKSESKTATAAGTVSVPDKCSINGEKGLQNLNLNKEQCAELAARLGVKSEPANQAGTFLDPSEAEPNWQWRETDSVSNPGRCVVERIVSPVKPPFCASVKEFPRKQGQRRANWKVLASQLPS